MTVRVFVADGHPMFRAGLCSALGACEGIDVVGEAAAGHELVRGLEEVRPELDVVVVDRALIDCSQVVTALGGEGTGAAGDHVLLVLDTVSEAEVVSALRNGSRGLITRQASSAELRCAIEVVAHGGMVFGAEPAARLRRCAEGWARSHLGPLFPQLTVREQEILRLMAGGQGNRRIARELVISEKTVRNHVSHVLAKLGATSRAEVMAMAHSAHVGPVEATSA